MEDIIPAEALDTISDRNGSEEMKMKMLAGLFLAVVACFALVAVTYDLGNSDAAVSDTFDQDGLRYTVLTVDDSTHTGTTSVAAIDPTTLSGVITIKGTVKDSTITDEEYTYVVTTIANSGFKRGGMDAVILPETVKTIGSEAFRYSAIRAINLSEVETIESLGLHQCANLSAIDITKLTSMGATAFCDCYALTDVKLPTNCDISGTAFTRDYALKTIDFSVCKEGLSIGARAFENTGITDLTLTSNIATIGAKAFFVDDNRAKFLTRVYSDITLAVSSSDKIFSFASIPSYSADPNQGLTAGVSYGFTSIVRDQLTYEILSVDDSTGEVCVKATDVKVIDGSITIPSQIEENGITYTVVKVNDHGFEDAAMITNVTLPNTLTTIGKDAFHRCTTLSTINLQNVTNIGEEAFYASGITAADLTNVTEWGISSFVDCMNLTNVTLPLNCDIPNTSFTRASVLKQITLPSKQDLSIGMRAFEDTSISEVTIPENVASIGQNAFRTTSLTTVISEKTLTDVDAFHPRISGEWDVDPNEGLQDGTTYTYTIKPGTIKITFVNGTSATYVLSKQYELVQLPNLDSKTIDGVAYSFVGWNSNPNATSGQKGNQSYYYDGDRTLYAIFVPNPVIKFVDGEEEILVLTPGINEVITLPYWVSNSGVTLQSWDYEDYDYETGKIKTVKNLPGQMIQVSKDLTFTASYAESGTSETYEVTFKEGADTTFMSIDVPQGTSIALPQLPGKVDAVSVGWAEQADATAADYLMGSQYKPTGDVTLYAVYAIKPFADVSFYEWNGSGYASKQTGMTLSGDAMSMPSPFETVKVSGKEYRFVGWKAAETEQAIPETINTDPADYVVGSIYTYAKTDTDGSMAQRYFYAVYATTYTVTFTNGTNNITVSGIAGEKVQAPNMFSSETGKLLKGYYTDSTSEAIVATYGTWIEIPDNDATTYTAVFMDVGSGGSSDITMYDVADDIVWVNDQGQTITPAPFDVTFSKKIASGSYGLVSVKKNANYVAGQSVVLTLLKNDDSEEAANANITQIDGSFWMISSVLENVKIKATVSTSTETGMSAFYVSGTADKNNQVRVVLESESDAGLATGSVTLGGTYKTVNGQGQSKYGAITEALIDTVDGQTGQTKEVAGGESKISSVFGLKDSKQAYYVYATYTVGGSAVCSMAVLTPALYEDDN